MLTYPVLAAVERSLRDRDVFSVYLDGGAGDPGLRAAWRPALDGAIAEVRARIGSERARRAAFEAALGHLEHVLPRSVTGSLGSPGWCAFVTPEEALQAGAVPTRVPTTIAWQKGARIVPYLWLLQGNREVVVALVDGRGARLFHCWAGEMRLLDRLHMVVEGGPPGHAPMRHGSFHDATHGAIGSDESDRRFRAARARMLDDLMDRIDDALTRDSDLVIGGAPGLAQQLMDTLPHPLAQRAIHCTQLRQSATDHEIYRLGEECSAAAADARAEAAVRHLLDASPTQGLVAATPAAVAEAVAIGAAQRVLISETFAASHAEDAEAIVRAAFDHDTKVELVRAPAATQLDARAEGILAGLRYRPAGGGTATTVDGSTRTSVLQ